MELPTLPTAAGRRSSAYAWYVVCVLTLFYVLSFVDRQILSLLVEPIKAHYGLTDTQIGLLQGLSFILLYVALSIPLARLADRSSRRNTILAGVVCWSLMTALCGLAPSFVLLFAFRMGVGAGEAALVPAAYSIFSDYFRKEDLGKATSFFQAGGFFGAGLAMMVGAAAVSAAQSLQLGEGIGLAPWQAVFIMVGVPGLLLSPLLLTVREPVRTDDLRRVGATAPAPAETIAFMLANRAALGALFIGFSSLSLVGYTCLSWLPTFLIRAHGMSAAQAGMTFGSIFAVFSTLGVMSGGALAGRMLRHGADDAAFRVGLLAAAGLAPGLLVLLFVEDLSLLLPAIVAITFCVVIPFGVAPAALAMLTPNRMRAQVSAIYLLFINLVGLAFGTLAVALVADFYFRDPMKIGASIAIVGLFATAIAMVALAWGRPAFRAAMQSSGEIPTD